MSIQKQKSIDLDRINAAVSRRFALQTMFGGAAALFGMPALGLAQNPAPKPAPRPPKKLPPGKLGDSQGGVKWVSNFNKVGESPSLATYTLHALGLGITVFNNSDGTAVLGINDFYAGNVDGYFETQFNGTFSKPVFLPGPNLVVIYESDGYLRVIIRNPDGSMQQTAVSASCVSNLDVAGDDTIVLVDSSNNLVGYTFQADGTATKSFQQQPEPRSINTNNVVLQAIDSNHFAYLVPDNAGQTSCYWMTRTSTLKSSIALLATGPFCVAGPYIYCLQNDYSTYFIKQFRLDAPDGFDGWRVQLDDDVTLPTNFVVANNAICFGYGSELRCVQLSDGSMSSIQVGGGQYLLNANPIYHEGGIIYICVPNGQLYAVDLASNGVNTVNYNFNSLPALSQGVGVENGQFVVMTYANNFYCMAGVDLSSLLHGYTTDSILMAEDMVASTTSSSGYMPANPAYRTIVHLSDENGVARANTAVRVEATDTVTITSGDTTATLTNPGDFQWFTTDYNGDLHLLCQADDISSPALYLWAAFMAANEAIVIYPDHVSVNNLKNKQANEYANAQSFDGTSLFPANQNHAGVASTVAGVLGGGSTFDPPAGPYSSYGSSTNMVYQATKGATGRVMSPGGQTSFTTTIDSDGTVNHTSGGSVSLNPTAAHLSWDDFKKDIVKAGKKIAKMVVQIADDIQHEITAIDGAIYQFTIDTFEKALGVITGFFKTILQDIKKAIEWISALFDWGAIKEVHSQIVSAVTSFQQSVRTYLGQAQSTVTDFFNNAATTVDNDFQAIASLLGGGSLGSKQPNGGNPQQVYTNPPAQSTGQQPGAYAQSQGMHSKLHDNIKKATKQSQPTTTPLAPDQFLASFTDTVSNQIPNLLQAKGYWDDLVAECEDIPKAFGTFLANPAGALKHAIGDVIGAIGDAAAIVLKCVGAAIGIVLGVLADMLDSMVSALTGGFEIPILGPLFKLIFGKDVTVLDLVAFVIAVPTVVAMKIGGVSGPQLGAESLWQLFAYCFSAMGGGIVDAISDAISEAGNDPVCIVDICFALVTMTLSAPYTGFDGNDAAVSYYVLGIVPILISFANAVNYWKRTGATAKAFQAACYSWQGFFGLIMLIFGISAAVKSPKAFDGPGHSVVIGNSFSNIGLLSKLVYPDQPEVTIATDVICPFAAAICQVFANVND